MRNEKEMQIKKLQVMRTCKETFQNDLITMEEAIEQLSGYWKYNHIESLLSSGHGLWSPFFNYRIYLEK